MKNLNSLALYHVDTLNLFWERNILLLAEVYSNFYRLTAINKEWEIFGIIS